MHLDKRESHAKRISCEIIERQFSDQKNDFKNEFLEEVFDQYLLSFGKKLSTDIEKIISYLDHADLYNTRVNITKVSIDTIIVDDERCYSMFLIQRNKSHLHVRTIYKDKDTDYKNDNEYISRPNLQWYKDRNFVIDYVDNLHNTPLGGMYGDCRDKTFIFTIRKNEYAFDIEDDYNYTLVEKGSLNNYNTINKIFNAISNVMYEIQNNELINA